jgi:hypothetical protein
MGSFRDANYDGSATGACLGWFARRPLSRPVALHCVRCTDTQRSLTLSQEYTSDRQVKLLVKMLRRRQRIRKEQYPFVHPAPHCATGA